MGASPNRTTKQNMGFCVERKGLLFILIGPSGAGKNTLMRNVLQWKTCGSLRQLPTATTRPKRSTETDGVEHLFLSQAQFDELVRTHALVEYQQVHGCWYYGTPRTALEEALAQGEYLIADIDVHGATRIQAAFPENTVLIFIAPPDCAVLEQRIRKRNTDSESEIQARLRSVETEMSYQATAHYVIINHDAEAASQQLANLIRALQAENEKLKTDLLAAQPTG